MAGKSFDFNKIKRSFFNITMKDGKELLVKMPSKKTFEKLTSAEFLGDDTPTEEALAAFDDICAELLSNNMAGHEITAEYMGENYDFEEKLIFLNAYMDFATGVKSDPN